MEVLVRTELTAHSHCPTPTDETESESGSWKNIIYFTLAMDFQRMAEIDSFDMIW